MLTGRWVKPKASDTIQSVAALYGSDPKALAELNDLPDDQALKERDVVFVPMQSGSSPGESPLPKSETDREGDPSPKDHSARAASPGKTKSNLNSKTDKTRQKPKQAKPVETAKNCVAANNPCLLWPVEGKIGTLFGSQESKPHDGIDILADKGTLVHAAAEGDVLYSGSEIKGYGNLVILRHEGGIITVYAHNDKNLVTEGAHVNRNAVIAEVGRSGNAAFSHLHFEVRISERPRNPIEYLPARP